MNTLSRSHHQRSGIHNQHQQQLKYVQTSHSAVHTDQSVVQLNKDCAGAVPGDESRIKATTSAVDVDYTDRLLPILHFSTLLRRSTWAEPDSISWGWTEVWIRPTLHLATKNKPKAKPLSFNLADYLKKQTRHFLRIYMVIVVKNSFICSESLKFSACNSTSIAD